MKENFEYALSLTLGYEGGWSNHPKDPGGATNMGVTIGTLKRLRIDVDGDGDSDIADLRKLRPMDVEKVYRAFYWDAVRADLLPSGVDLAVFDFAVNSGPAQAAKALQRAVGVTPDGDIGPRTLAALAYNDASNLVSAITEKRMRFLRSLKTWPTFGKGWARRVSGIGKAALELAEDDIALIKNEPKALLSMPETQEEPAIEIERKKAMNGFSLTRLAIYGIGLVAGVAATWAASQGLGTYDSATGLFDLAPFNVNAVIATAVATAGNALAGVALLRGWGKK
jgi:lysozyme family protein